jgi:hypothetical protein
MTYLTDVTHLSKEEEPYQWLQSLWKEGSERFYMKVGLLNEFFSPPQSIDLIRKAIINSETANSKGFFILF